MKRFLVWTLRGCGAIALLFALGAGGGYLWLRASLPKTEGTIEIAGLEATVEVLRDADGLVTIRAGGERDAALALGYVHAQDRLWQMDLMRRIGAGRLSEILGSATLGADRLMRTLGYYRVAKANAAHLSAPVRALFEAYAAGVNAFISEPGGPLPPEFQFLRYEAEPWRVADSLVWGRLMARQLSGNWPTELLRKRLARRLTPDQIGFLWPDTPAGALVTTGKLSAPLEGTRSEALTLGPPWEPAPKGASNSWVLAGSQTQGGRPILANDPHLALTAPGLWYLARIETPELTVTGATTPGMPFVVFGHNGRIAWGFTNTDSDTQDLFIERVAKDDPARYQTPEGSSRFETREEVIAVKGTEAERLTVRATGHGPVISDVLPLAADAVGPNEVLALAWPALRPDDRTAEALYGINRARDWDGFRAALRNFHSPQQNIVYADTGGTIAFIAPGRVPIRKRGDGRAPVPGWSGEFDWTGFIPFDELPMTVNPAPGRIVAANNKIVPDDYPYLITADWADHYRAERINEMLDSSHPGTLEGSRAMQQDIVSLGVRELLPLLLEARPDTDEGRLALTVLGEWDGRMDREQAAPLVFFSWIRELNRVLLSDELGEAFANFQYPKMDLLARILTDDQIWCDDIGTEAREDCAAQLATALEAAL
ncbi:MAG: penicillin acylase family protein, partial [Proteobacteria bacterium]|nr:penicillin acylase family protein [Pseudomonadota bacterium]